MQLHVPLRYVSYYSFTTFNVNLTNIVYHDYGKRYTQDGTTSSTLSNTIE